MPRTFPPESRTNIMSVLEHVPGISRSRCYATNVMPGSIYDNLYQIW